MLQVVIITPSPESLAALASALAGEGFAATLHRPAGESEVVWPQPQADALILDLTTPWEEGQPRRLLGADWARGTVATLALLRREQLSQYDFTLGIDDFVLMPATTEELVARLRQALWRHAHLDSQNILKCGDLVIDQTNYKVFLSGRPVDLTYKEYELLRFLVANPGKVFTREVLLNRVWGYDFYGGARTVDVHIRRLRSKIEDAQHTFIETVRNVGYRFLAPPRG